MKYQRMIIIFLCSLLLFFILAYTLFFTNVLEMDKYVYDIIAKSINERNTYIFSIITSLGSTAILILVTMIAMLILRNKKDSILIIINLILSLLLNQGLKALFMRQRPLDIDLIIEKGYSFPSGHSAVSLAFYGFIIYLIWTRVKNKKLKYITCSLISLIILLIGISRIYLGVHYFSDVIGGYLISLSYLIIFIIVIEQEKVKKYFEKL